MRKEFSSNIGTVIQDSSIKLRPPTSSNATCDALPSPFANTHKMEVPSKQASSSLFVYHLIGKDGLNSNANLKQEATSWLIRMTEILYFELNDNMFGLRSIKFGSLIQTNLSKEAFFWRQMSRVSKRQAPHCAQGTSVFLDICNPFNWLRSRRFIWV